MAVIPARGGSKRIPDKNIKSFHGKPMIGYAIDIAKSTGLFDEVIVSTDSKVIAELAISLGASVPFVRPATLADDYTGTSAVVRHAIEWMETQHDDVELVCCLYPAVPLLKQEHLLAGYQQLLEHEDVNFAFSVGTYRYPVMRALKLNESHGVEMLFPQFSSSRSQDLPETYHDAGQFYWGRREAWKSRQAVFSSRSRIIELPPYRVIDIDTEDDWRIAELYYSLVEKANL